MQGRTLEKNPENENIGCVFKTNVCSTEKSWALNNHPLEF
jgi:hypothetical protein